MDNQDSCVTAENNVKIRLHG